MPTRNHILDIAWVVPPVFSGSGGHMTIFRNAAYLSQFGHRNTIYCADYESRFGSDRELKNYIDSNFVKIDATVVRGWNLEPCDVAVATHWSTAYPVHEFAGCSTKFYFVQDYEPYFHPMGVDYLRAENTYRLGFSCVTIGRWLTSVLRDRYLADAEYFDFAVDTTTYNIVPAVHRAAKIAFCAQPEKPRRCFELGIRALEIVNRTHPEVGIVLFGSNSQPSPPIAFPHTNLGVISPRECAEQYRSSQVGLILSSSNPSLIGFEMMACGCAVVDLDRENNRFDYGVGTVSLAEPSPEALAKTLIALLEDRDLRTMQVDRALQLMSKRTYERSARRFEMLLLTGWITGRVNSTGDLHLDEFQSLAENAAALDAECVQTFKPTQDKLCEVDVSFAKPSGDGMRTSITCEVQDVQENRTLAIVSKASSEIQDWDWLPIRLPVQVSSKDRDYRVVIRLSGKSGLYPRPLYTTKPAYGRGELFLSGKRTSGALKFKTYCAVDAWPPDSQIGKSGAASVPFMCGSPAKGSAAQSALGIMARSVTPPTQQSFARIIEMIDTLKSELVELRGFREIILSSGSYRLARKMSALRESWPVKTLRRITPPSLKHLLKYRLIK